jgi:hypothetical protein
VHRNNSNNFLTSQWQVVWVDLGLVVVEVGYCNR